MMTETPTLVVDDEPSIRDLLQLQLSSLGCRVAVAADGRAALDLLHADPVDLIFTDIRMPKMSGIQLLQEVKAISPETSVVVLSGYATVEDTVQALRLGALDFIHKPFRRADVERAVERYRRLRRDAHLTANYLSQLQSSSQGLTIPSDKEAARVVATSLTRDLVGLGLCTPAERESVTLALHEAVLNAIIHGNLGVPSSLKNQDVRLFENLIDERRRDPIVGSRTVRIEATADRTRAEFVIEDQGEGFDHRRLPDPTEAASLMEVSGRGLLIIRLTMDQVRWNDRGNRIMLSWKARGPSA
jgi:CheY-like chemotaxis protein/anti-sigma regulatory factor (Ser/Thr protein kinase)